MSNLVVNKQIGVANGVPNVAFHPQLFENINQNPGNKSDLQRIQTARGMRLPYVDIKDLKSVGSYKMTPRTRYDSASTVSTGSTNPNKSNHHAVMRNIHIENPLSYLFFSERNVQDLQKLIRMTVFKHMNQVIDNQSHQELLIIMRSLYLEYALHPSSLDSATSEEEYQRILVQTVNEVRRLNEITINEVVPMISSQLQQYNDYLRDASTQPVQINLPVNESIKGQKNYRSTTDVLLGTGF